MQSVRRFSSAVAARAPKTVKGKAPPKKASKNSFAKKKVKDTGSATTSNSAYAAKIGSSQATTKLNTSAPKLDLPQVTPAVFTKEHVGTVFEAPSNVASQLYALDVLQKQGGYQYFSQIASVLRESSIELADILALDGSSKDRRVILDGPAGSGKSVAMLQAITLALQQKWVVVSVPRSEALVDSTCPYAWDEQRKSWRQDTYMSELLGRIAEANKSVLQLQNTSRSFSFDRHSIPEKATLYKLVEIGSQDPGVSHSIFDAFMTEMNLEGRPKLLLTLDNLSISTLPTRYRDRDYNVVHPFDLEIIKNFVSYLNGTKLLTNGVVLTNTSSKPPCVPRSLQIALGKAQRLPFEVIDDRIAQGVSGLRSIHVGGYTSTEATSVLQHYASAGLIRGHTSADITESFVKQRTLMGGVGREVFKSCLKQL